MTVVEYICIHAHLDRLLVAQFGPTQYVLPVNHFGPARYDCPGPQRASGQRSIIDSPVALRRDAFITLCAIIDFPQRGAPLRAIIDRPAARDAFITRAIIDSSDTLRRHASLRTIIDFPQRAIIDSSDTLRRNRFPAA